MAKAAQKLELNPSENIPYDQLVLSQTNVRRVKNGVSIEELAEDIGRRRLILSLNVRPVLDDDGKETGTFEVPAGGRRFMALGILIKQKKMAKNALVPCIVNRNGDTLAEEDSLVENTHRADLHPLDQYRTIKRLVDLGLDDHEEIAARLLLTPTIVKQRLKLAAVSPKILERFEKGEIRYDQLTRFTVTDDHARQEQVWEVVSRSNSSDPNHITRLLTETAVRGDDRRAVYVGSEAYEAAGGVILRDLFNEGSTNWFQDAPLLEQLVFDKLKVDARAIQDEGWKWVEAGISFPYGHTSGMRRIYGEPQEMSAEELERYDALNAEFEKLEAEYDEAPDYDEEVEDKLEQLEAEIERLNDRPYAYDAEQVARAGVFITLGANGQIVVERGFVRPEDEPQEEEDDEEVAESNDANGHDHGTNGVVVNGKKASGEDDDDEPEDPVIRPLPDGLIFDLTAQRTLALRNALAGDPDVAFVAALHTFVLQTFHHSMSDSCLEVSRSSPSVRDTVQTAGLVLAAIVVGAVGWSGEPLALPFAIAFPVLWSLAPSRLAAALVSAGYFLAASRGLPQGVINFYGSGFGAGFWLWIAAALGFVIVHAVLWTARLGWGRALRYSVAAVLMSVPPFGIVGWAHPITAAGILFPGWGWWGLAVAAIGLLAMTARIRPRAAVVLTGFWILSASSLTSPDTPEGWIGVDTAFGGGHGEHAGYAQHLETIALVRSTVDDGHDVVVLPESSAGIWTPTVEALWRRALANLDVTVLVGAVIVDHGGYDNVIVAVSSARAEILYRERMPVPVSMWRPWLAWSGETGGARAHFFANPVVDVSGLKVAPLICYEQLLIWPIIQSALHRPEIIIATGNGWWTQGTNIVAIQKASAIAWAALFGIPVVMAFNT